MILYYKKTIQLLCLNMILYYKKTIQLKYKFAVVYEAGIIAGLSRLREMAALFTTHGYNSNADKVTTLSSRRSYALKRGAIADVKIARTQLSA